MYDGILSKIYLYDSSLHTYLYIQAFPRLPFSFRTLNFLSLLDFLLFKMYSRFSTLLLSVSAIFTGTLAAPTGSNSSDGFESLSSRGLNGAPAGGYRNAGYFVNW